MENLERDFEMHRAGRRMASRKAKRKPVLRVNRKVSECLTLPVLSLSFSSDGSGIQLRLISLTPHWQTLSQAVGDSPAVVFREESICGHLQ